MTPSVEIITWALSLGTVIAGLFALSILALIVYKGPFLARAREFFAGKATLIAFLVALGSVLASIFYSNVAGFTPCSLCWWQRVFLYPLAIIFGLALWKKKTDAGLYGLVFSGIGALIAIYHTYLQFGGIPLVPCAVTGASCSQRYFVEFGYVTIPTMALTAFLVIFLVFVLERTTRRSTQHE